MANTWLIVGGSSGIGLAMAMNCLKRGQKVIATGRNITKTSAEHPEFESKGGKWLQLDMTRPETEDIVRETVSKAGVSVIVNNGAYALPGAVEDLSDAECHRQMETNYFGPLRVIRGALSHLRSLKSSVIINVSSGAGIMGQPGVSQYCASKFALEGLSEGLRKEVASFNVRVHLIDLGAFRTTFADGAQYPEKASLDNGGNGRVSKSYIGEAPDLNLERMTQLPRMAPGDPAKAAKAIVDVALGEGQGAEISQYLRVVLGADCMRACRTKEKEFTDNVNASEAISGTTNFDSL